MSIPKFLFLAGAKFRNPSLWKHFHFLKDSEKWDIDMLKSYQENNLLEFLNYSAKKSPYYNKLFKSIGWTDDIPFTMELFRQIPVLTKDVLIAQNDTIHTKDSFNKLFFCETSGTSGQVLTFRRNEFWDSFNRASIMRGYSWYHVNPWDFNIYFWGYNLSFLKKIKLRLMDFLVNRYRMFNYTEKGIQQLVKKIPKATYIEGYSSMIYELAEAAKDYSLDTSKIKMVKGTSEKIYPHYQQVIKKVFGKQLVSEYGAAETGIIAFECPYGNMHINMEGVYVETDQDNEIIVTNFISSSFPVIRYRLGDAIRLQENPTRCKCGMAHPVITEVTGRVGKVIYGYLKKYPSLTFYYIFKNLFFDKNLHFNYQAHQVEKGILQIRIKENFTSEEENLILDECKKYFDDDIRVELVNSNDFRTSGGKLRDFITTLN